MATYAAAGKERAVLIVDALCPAPKPLKGCTDLGLAAKPFFT